MQCECRRGTKVNMNGQQLFVCKEEWSPSMYEEGPEPPHIKEEPEEHWISQVEEKLTGIKEFNTIKLTFKPDPVKNGQQLYVYKVEWSPSMDQEEPELPHIKEEQEELWTNRERERLPGPKEADFKKLTFKPDHVNSEPLASTSSGQIKTEADGEDCGVSEAARNLDPAGGLDMHSRESPFSCMVCKKGFRWKSILNLHMIMIHGGKRPFITVSKQGFTQQTRVNTHMLGHTGERAFVCSVCKKDYKMKSSLKQHMKTHSKERPFGCTVCKKAYKQKRDLQNHMITHTGERAFSCTVCEKDFFLKSILKQHMLTHNGVRPFICKVCKRDFKRRRDLQNHVITHTGEKPFSCTVCENDFYLKSGLKRHMMTHTGEKPFNCTVCKNKFTRRIGLRQHMKTHSH